MDDEQLIRVWLHGRPEGTRRSYRRYLARLKASLGETGLAGAELEQLQRHVDTLGHLAPRTLGTAIGAIRSFYGFHCRLGTLQANPALALRQPAIPNDLAERILTEDEVKRLIAGAEDPRSHLALRLLYHGGIRAAELCNLRWGQVAPRDAGGQLTVHGKGGKTRAILLPASVYRELEALRPPEAQRNGAVFPAARDPRRPIGTRQLLRIVKRAAKAAGLTDRVSNHWMRHSHASHALDKGAPITLVRDTLGHASIATTNKYAHARPGDSSARFLDPGDQE